jgi:uncharacterized protein with HEPN domain
MNRHPDRAQDYLEHILEALERIQRYTTGKSVEEFEADTLTQDAVMRNLGIVGEAARRLMVDAPEFAAAHPEIPLAKIYAMRNRITHAYEEVDLKIVWNLVAFDASDLKTKVAVALDQFGRGISEKV